MVSTSTAPVVTICARSCGHFAPAGSTFPFHKLSTQSTAAAYRDPADEYARSGGRTVGTVSYGTVVSQAKLQPGLLVHRFPAMGTTVSAALASPPLNGDEARRALSSVERLFREVEQVASRFRPDSELSQLNQMPDRWVIVSPLLFELIQEALAMAERTEGWFDPTILPALEAAGYRSSWKDGRFVGGNDGPSGSRRSGDYRVVRLDPLLQAVHLTPGVRLDLGGIGKGWTVDRAFERLARLGPCLVNAGGDLRGTGGDAIEGWPIQVENPWQPDSPACETIWLREGAVCSSSILGRRWLKDAKVQHHLIDPRRGQPSAGDIVAATVHAPTAAEAEVAAKVFIVGEPLAWERIARRLHVTEARLFTNSGGSRGMITWLQTHT